MFPVNNQNSGITGADGNSPTPNRRGSISNSRRSPRLVQSDVNLPDGEEHAASAALGSGAMASAAALGGGAMAAIASLGSGAMASAAALGGGAMAAIASQGSDAMASAASLAGRSDNSETEQLREAAINLLEMGDTEGALRLLSLLEAMSLEAHRAADDVAAGATGSGITTNRAEFAEIRHALIRSKRAYEGELRRQQGEQSGVAYSPSSRWPSRRSVSSPEPEQPPLPPSSPPPPYNADPVVRRRDPGPQQPSEAPTPSSPPAQRGVLAPPPLPASVRWQDEGFDPSTNLSRLKYHLDGCKQWSIYFTDPAQADQVLKVIMKAVARNQSLNSRFLSSLLVRMTAPSEDYMAALTPPGWAQSRLTLYTRDYTNIVGILTRHGSIVALPAGSTQPTEEAAAAALLPPYPASEEGERQLFNSNNLRFAARSSDSDNVIRLWFSDGLETGSITIWSANDVVIEQHAQREALCIPLPAAQDRNRLLHAIHNSDNAARSLAGMMSLASDMGYLVDHPVSESEFVVEFVMEEGVFREIPINWIGVGSGELAALRQQVDELYQRSRR